MSQLQKILVWCFNLLFIVTPLLFLPWTSELFEFNKLTFTYLITITITTLWVIKMLYFKKFIFTRTILDLPLTLFLLVTLISLTFSIDIHTSLIGYYGRWNGGLYSLLSYSLLYWAFVSNLDKNSTLTIIRRSVFSLAVVSLYGILEHFGASISCLAITGKLGVDCWVQDVQNRVFATLGQPNWLAAYIVGLIFIPLHQYLQTKSWKDISGLLTLILFLCLIYTKSRSGIAAFALSYIFYTGYYFFKNRQISLRHTLITISSVVLIFAIKNPVSDYFYTKAINISYSFFTQKISPQFSDSLMPTPETGPALETGGTESGEIRKIVWQGALAIWRSSTKTIFLGTGPETFAMAYYQHRPLAHNATSEWELLYNKAHNEFLNQLATTGILGFIAYLFLLITIARIFFSKPSVLNIALFSSWLTLSVTNFWGFSVVLTQLLLFLLPAIAICLNTSPQFLNPTKLKAKNYLLIILFTITGIYVLIQPIKIWISDRNYAKSQKYLSYFSSQTDPQDLITAYTSANDAYDLNPNEPFIDTQLADTAAYMAIYTAQTDATSSAQFSTLASAAVQKALSISPSHPIHYKSAARSYILLSATNPEYLNTADKILEYAQSLSPTDPRLPYNRAIIAKYQSDTAKAEKFFNVSLQLKPDFGDAKHQLELLASPSAKTK